MISYSRLACSEGPKRLPIGSSSPKNLRANVSLTTTTFREVAVSCAVIPRPLRIGVPMASKYSAVTRFHEDKLSSLGPGAGRPSTQTAEPQPAPGGEYRHRATEDTPGMSAIESWMRVYKGDSCAGR